MELYLLMCLKQYQNSPIWEWLSLCHLFMVDNGMVYYCLTVMNHVVTTIIYIYKDIDAITYPIYNGFNQLE